MTTAAARPGRRSALAIASAAGLALVLAFGAPAAAAAAAPPAGSGTATDSVRAAVDCLGDRSPVTVLRGHQADRFTSEVPTDGAVDAATALWLQVDNWPISFGGGEHACWYGGRVIGTFPQSTPWSDFHHTGAVNTTNEGIRIVGIRVHNIGDGIRIRDGASDFRISGAHLSFIHDDCVENDQLYSGVVEDSLLDGCYVAFSARPSSTDTVEGRRHTVTFRGNVVRLEPMPTVYKGKVPGNGGFFKWDEHGRAPKLVIEDNVFRADQRPNHQDLGVPKGYDVRCRNNVVVWLGKGRYPDRLPKCFRVTRQRSVWDAAVARWRAAHPLNP